ncbi:hypothetical protein [Deinococcus sp. PESE-13]
MTLSMPTDPEQAQAPALLSPAKLQHHYALGRDLAIQLCAVLPHVVVGKRGRGIQRLAFQDDVERLLRFVATHELDLKIVAFEVQPSEIRAWINASN